MEVSSELAREVVLRDDVRHVEERENGFKFVTLDGQDHEGIPIKQMCSEALGDMVMRYAAVSNCQSHSSERSAGC